MDIDFSNPKLDFKSEGLEPSISDLQKTRTSLRLQYEAEARVLRRSLGGIESIRHSLGLSRRKMCQLLLVDPSTWTRWMKDEEKIPPHIYKSLQWYMISLEKYPMIHPLHQVSIAKEGMELEKDKIIRERMKLEARIRELEQQMQVKPQPSDMEMFNKPEVQVGLGWKMLLLFNTILVLFFLMRLF